MVNIGLISFYLKFKFERNRAIKTLKLFQQTDINKIQVKYHVNPAKPCNTPIKEGILLINKSSEAM